MSSTSDRFSRSFSREAFLINYFRLRRQAQPDPTGGPERCNSQVSVWRHTSRRANGHLHMLSVIRMRRMRWWIGLITGSLHRLYVYKSASASSFFLLLSIPLLSYLFISCSPAEAARGLKNWGFNIVSPSLPFHPYSSLYPFFPCPLSFSNPDGLLLSPLNQGRGRAVSAPWGQWRAWPTNTFGAFWGKKSFHIFTGINSVWIFV